MKWIIGIAAVMLIAHILFKREARKARRRIGSEEH